MSAVEIEQGTEPFASGQRIVHAELSEGVMLEAGSDGWLAALLLRRR